MSLTLSDEIVQSSGLSEEQLTLEIIIMLFQQEKLSLGKASRLAKMNQLQFRKLLASRGICIHYDVAEFQEDLKTLRDKGWI